MASLKIRIFAALMVLAGDMLLGWGVSDPAVTELSAAPTAIADTRNGGYNTLTKTTVKIDGMMCGMCEAHICDTIRKAVPAAKKVAASRGKKEATFLTEAPVDADMLKSAIDATGYSCLAVESVPYEKKGLFGWK